MVDISDYRKNFEAELEAQNAPGAGPAWLRAAAATDSVRTAGARPMAAGAPASAAGPDLGNAIPTLLATLSNSAEAAAIREAALTALRAAMFLGERFAPFRAEFLAVLRRIMTHEPAGELRDEAIEALAGEKDADTQATLKKGLNDPQSALVAPAKALQLLSLDDHANIAEVAREVFHKAADLPTREAALRVLSTDAQSQGLLTEVLEDKGQARSLRALSATGLNLLNPQKFAEVAQGIVKDAGDFEDIRASALGALANTPLHGVIRGDTSFVDAVKTLGAQTPLSNLRAAAGRFLAKP